MTTMLFLLLALSAVQVALLLLVIWNWREFVPSLDANLVTLRNEISVLRHDVAVLLGSVQRQDQEREQERREVEGKIGSFLPGEAEVAKIEKAHQGAAHGFLSAQTPPSPLSRGSGISGGRSGPASSTSRARNSRRGS